MKKYRSPPSLGPRAVSFSKAIAQRKGDLCAIKSRRSPFFSNKNLMLSHGRKITRQISVFRNPQINSKEWSHLQSIIQVKRSGFRGRKDYQETAYYVSSLSQDAQTFAGMIQGHWRIENQLHWVKDVIFKEDREPIRQFQAATNFSTLKTLVLNFLKSLG